MNRLVGSFGCCRAETDLDEAVGGAEEIVGAEFG